MGRRILSPIFRPEIPTRAKIMALFLAFCAAKNSQKMRICPRAANLMTWQNILCFGDALLAPLHEGIHDYQ